jgi:hypothetical protein
MAVMIDGGGLLRGRSKRWWTGAVGVAVLLAGSACATRRPTWYQDIAPMLANHCTWCHQEGGIAPFSLTNFDNARDQSLRMVEQIELGAMPPFSAQEDADCTPRFRWSDDPRLSEAEKTTLRRWIADGYLLGDPVETPPIVSQDLEHVSMTLAPAGGWTASGDGDQFICYLFDLENTDMEWLSGLQIRPDNAAIIHHALVFALDPEEAQPLVTEHGIGQPFWCQAGLAANLLIHAWFPGNQPLQLPPKMAMPIVPNAKIGVQIHYHPHGGVYEPDRTALDLQFSATRPERLYVSTTFGNETMAPRLLPGPGDTQDGISEFVVRKNVADHVEHMRIPVQDAGQDGDSSRLFLTCTGSGPGSACPSSGPHHVVAIRRPSA